MSYQPGEKGLVVIPYRNQPLFNLRSRITSLSKGARWQLAAPFLVSVLALLIVVVVFATPQYLTVATVAKSLLASVLSLIIAAFSYLLFSVRDLILCDRFTLFVPLNVLRRGSDQIKQAFAATTGTVQYYGLIIYWGDLLEVAITDKPLKTGKHRFYLNLSRKSGSSVSLPICDIPKESIDLLAREIEKNAPFCRNLSQLAELGRFQDFERGALPGVTYDQLWESLITRRIEATSFAPLKPNYKLQNERLTVIRQIASGGFSSVYLVEESDGAKLILKEFVLPFSADQELAAKAAEHFKREARLLKALRHEQIARVYDHFVEEGRNYLLIEYIHGRTLRQLVFDEGPQSEEKVLAYAIQIAEILQYLHGQETPIVHRDLTPDNLIVSDYGKLYLIDFGSANEFTGAATGTLVGKHAYMAPEQVRGKAVPNSDIYSFGQTMYYCLSACEPKALMSSKLPRTDTFFFKKLDEVIRRSTELDLERRLTLTELVDCLVSNVDDQGVAANE
jgi:tRNA A-37 threonylcarbamoyl transferase component Bud32